VGHAPSALYSKLLWDSSKMFITLALSIIIALIISLIVYYLSKKVK